MPPRWAPARARRGPAWGLLREGNGRRSSRGILVPTLGPDVAMVPVTVVQVLLPVLGLVGPLLAVMGLPGTWLLLALAGLAEWGTGPRLFSTGGVATAVALALAGEVWEFLASSSRARRAGAGRRGALGALAGGIAGAVAVTVLLPVPLVGTLVGGGLGAFVLSSLLERGGGRSTGEALRIGRAAAVGQVLGVAGKVAAAVAVYLLVLVEVFVG